jgi:tetratricopeptide (TPR) repeat protein
MSKLGDTGKAKEAQDAMAEGDKHLSTGLMKWKPDYMQAEPCYQKAGRAFKAAGLVDSAIKAWRKAADCSLKMGMAKQAVVTLEAASRELSYSSSTTSGNNYKEIASQFLSEAGSILCDLGETPRAAELKLRAGKLLEGFSNEKAAALYDEAANFFDGDEEKDVYAKEALGKVLNHQLGLGKHASAMKTMDKLAGEFARLMILRAEP